ncbi:MAG: aminotransferase class I/II-fold pyridoxal phosphate-dependent enzyme [Planctomycetes bacterium]|nr:aminotransferase class I/II-fold pyridoxal phosphate-dependent enzyme [Planctomycetota bacterium]
MVVHGAQEEKPFKINVSERLKRLPPYLFGQINAMKSRLRAEGRDVIDLGMGNPTDPAPETVIQKLTEAARDPRNSRYSQSSGVFNLRRELARKYERRYGVSLDPEAEVVATIGSKEGFSHMCLALLGPGDTAIVPDPAFPIHVYAVALAEGNVISVPLGNDQEFLKRIQMVVENLYPRPRVLVLNYPHNPTAMVAPDVAFYEEIVRMAKRFGFLVLHDFAYGETCFDDYVAPSFLQARGAKDVAVELTTMSKAYNMAGWRVGYCAGNPDMCRALMKVKGYYDYGIFQSIQIASIIAMREGDEFAREQALVYQQRRDTMIRGLHRLGWTGTESPKASMFVWAKVPDDLMKRMDTIDLSLYLIEKGLVAVAPGRAFGPSGEGYLRLALVENEKRINQAMRHIKNALQALDDKASGD